MVDLPKKKVGIVACSGEELAEGTVTRLAALKVLEKLRPSDTVTICLPLFLAGGEGDRAFARFYPTIAVDGCDRRCAARATEMYSGKPAASLVVSDLVAENGMDQPRGRRRLNDPGLQAVAITAERMAELVDELLGKLWNRRTGVFIEPAPERALPLEPEPVADTVATCSCGSGIPIQKIAIAGQEVTLVGLPLIFQQFYQDRKVPGDSTARELLEMVKVYNPVQEEASDAYTQALASGYELFYRTREASR